MKENGVGRIGALRSRIEAEGARLGHGYPRYLTVVIGSLLDELARALEVGSSPTRPRSGRVA